MLPKDLVDLLCRERIEFHDERLLAKRGRDDVPGFILAIDFHDHPRLVHSVPASPIRVAQEMRAGLEEDVDDAETDAEEDEELGE